MISGENFFDQPIKNDKITYENIRKIAKGQGDNYTTGCLLNYQYIYKMIAIDLSKQQALDADLRAIQQINFTGNQIEQEIQESSLFSKKQEKLF